MAGGRRTPIELVVRRICVCGSESCLRNWLQSRGLNVAVGIAVWSHGADRAADHQPPSRPLLGVVGPATGSPSPAPVPQPLQGGAAARPFLTRSNAYGEDVYLRIAPELYLNRLVVAGMGRVYEIGGDFRNGGADGTHNPEFTAMEATSPVGTIERCRRWRRISSSAPQRLFTPRPAFRLGWSTPGETSSPIRGRSCRCCRPCPRRWGSRSASTRPLTGSSSSVPGTDTLYRGGPESGALIEALYGHLVEATTTTQSDAHQGTFDPISPRGPHQSRGSGSRP